MYTVLQVEGSDLSVMRERIVGPVGTILELRFRTGSGDIVDRKLLRGKPELFRSYHAQVALVCSATWLRCNAFNMCDT